MNDVVEAGLAHQRRGVGRATRTLIFAIFGLALVIAFSAAAWMSFHPR